MTIERIPVAPVAPVAPVDAAGAEGGAPSAVTDPVAERLARYMRAGTLALAALPPLSLYIHLP